MHARPILEGEGEKWWVKRKKKNSIKDRHVWSSKVQLCGRNRVISTTEAQAKFMVNMSPHLFGSIA